MSAKSVFISHSSKNDGVVRELRQTLESLGVEAWTDSERLSGGDPLSPKIREAIENADCFLLVASPEALDSDWVERETEHAKTVRKAEYKIVPLAFPGTGMRNLRRLLGE